MGRSIASLWHTGTGRANALAHGISGSLPLGSKVVGTRGELTIGKGFYASGPVWIEAVSQYMGADFHPHITIGNDVRASPRLHISAVLSIEIGEWSLFGENVFISDHQHGATSGELQYGPDTAPALRPLSGAAGVRIGRRCHLGNNVVVTPGVSIGDGCIVGANSVVTRDLPAGTIAAGSPARVLKVWDEASHTWRDAGAA